MINAIANSLHVRHIANTLMEFFANLDWKGDACPSAVSSGHWEQLKSMGFKRLGNGYFSVAIVHDDYPDIVFKVSLRDGDAAQAYILKCREWQDTPKQRYLPYVYFTLKVGHFWCCAMPKYTPNSAELCGMSYKFDPNNVEAVLDVPENATWITHILADVFPKWDDVLLFAATTTITAEAAERHMFDEESIGNHYSLRRVAWIAQSYFNEMGYLMSNTVRGHYKTYSQYLETVAEWFELERNNDDCFDAAWELYAGLRHTLEAMLADEVLYDTLTGINKFFNGLARFDLHGDNWMFTRDDNGFVHIVITDPVSFTEKRKDEPEAPAVSNSDAAKQQIVPVGQSAMPACAGIKLRRLSEIPSIELVNNPVADVGTALQRIIREDCTLLGGGAGAAASRFSGRGIRNCGAHNGGGSAHAPSGMQAS